MAFTHEQLGFVVRVVRTGDGDSVGTGILVAPNAVLTCAHVVLKKSEWECHKDKPSLIDAEIGDASLTVEVQGRPIEVILEGPDAPKFHPDGEDLVLVTLKESVDITPATFLTDFDEQTARALEKSRVDIYGYRKVAKHTTAVEAQGKTISKEFADAGKRGLLAFGLLDRVIEGYSGGPVVLGDMKEPHCIGMATLGGEGRMAMVAVGSDVIHEFYTSVNQVPAAGVSFSASNAFRWWLFSLVAFVAVGLTVALVLASGAGKRSESGAAQQGQQTLPSQQVDNIIPHRTAAVGSGSGGLERIHKDAAHYQLIYTLPSSKFPRGVIIKLSDEAPSGAKLDLSEGERLSERAFQIDHSAGEETERVVYAGVLTEDDFDKAPGSHKANRLFQIRMGVNE